MAKRNNFTWEDRKRIIQRLLPPENVSVKELADGIGVSDVTFYDWRTIINNGYLDKKSNKKQEYSAEDKFHIVMERYSLIEAEFNTYYHEKGLYPETVKEWQQNGISGNEGKQSLTESTEIKPALKKEKEIYKNLQSELKRKEKALAEAEALLVLCEKTDAIWGVQRTKNQTK